MAKLRLFYEEQNRSPLQQLWFNFTLNPMANIGFIIFLMLIFISIFAHFIVPYGPNTVHNGVLLLPPSWSQKGDIYFMLGTDDIGRDLLSRLIVGTQLTFGLGIISVLISMVIGVVIGASAGLSKGVKSSFLNHLLDLTLSIPSLLIAIIIVAILGPGLTNTIWAIVLALLPQFIHTIRTLIQEELKKDYIVAYRLDGATSFQVLKNAIFPNIFEQVIIMATLAISNAVLDIAALGFLRLGAQPPTPEWGAMLFDSLDLLYLAPWTVAFPGIMLFITVLSTNLVGDGLRDALILRRES